MRIRYRSFITLANPTTSPYKKSNPKVEIKISEPKWFATSRWTIENHDFDVFVLRPLPVFLRFLFFGRSFRTFFVGAFSSGMNKLAGVDNVLWLISPMTIPVKIVNASPAPVQATSLKSSISLRFKFQLKTVLILLHRNTSLSNALHVSTGVNPIKENLSW